MDLDELNELAKLQAEADEELRLLQKAQAEYQPVEPLEAELAPSHVVGELKDIAQNMAEYHAEYNENRRADEIKAEKDKKHSLVILKPSPDDVQDLYLGSLRALGFHAEEHDIRFVEDDWESPTLGAWGLGWEVWLNGMEVSQFTYFQQVGGIDLSPVSVELTYGLERLAMYLQGKDSVYDLA